MDLLISPIVFHGASSSLDWGECIGDPGGSSLSEKKSGVAHIGCTSAFLVELGRLGRG